MSSCPGSLEQNRGVKARITFLPLNLHLSTSSLSVSKQSELKTYVPEERPLSHVATAISGDGSPLLGLPR